MATPAEKLASSLEILQALQEQGIVAIRSSALTRTHRERLVKNGFLQEVMKGWYTPSRPDEAAGESTAWYASFWEFCAAYLEARFSDNWSLSPQQSLSIHAENWNVPGQLLVRTKRGDNKPVALPHDTSLFIFRGALPAPEQCIVNQGLRLYSLPAALIATGPTTFRQLPTDMRVALAMIQDASEVLTLLLEGGHSKVAGRLAGAFRNIGNDKVADQIIKTMRTADFKVQEEDPFEAAATYQPPPRERSPYVNRLRLMWQEMREQITSNFPEPPGLPADPEHYLKYIDDIYVTDAYNSLSIEGYRVSPELIERVRSGDWNPANDEDDRQRRGALAARGRGFRLFARPGGGAGSGVGAIGRSFSMPPNFSFASAACSRNLTVTSRTETGRSSRLPSRALGDSTRSRLSLSFCCRSDSARTFRVFWKT